MRFFLCTRLRGEGEVEKRREGRRCSALRGAEGRLKPEYLQSPLFILKEAVRVSFLFLRDKTMLLRSVSALYKFSIFKIIIIYLIFVYSRVWLCFWYPRVTKLKTKRRCGGGGGRVGLVVMVVVRTTNL